MKLARLLKLVVMVVLLVLVVRLVPLGALARTIGSANPILLGLAVVAVLADRALMIAKWYPLLRTQAASISWWRAARAYLAAGFASLVLPASVGADMLRAVALGRPDGVVMEIAASIAMERMLGMVAAGVPTLLAVWIVLSTDVSLGVLLPWGLASLGVAVVALLLPLDPRVMRIVDRLLGRHRSGKWGGLIHRFATAYAIYRRFPRMLMAVAAASVVEQFVPVLVHWIISRALGVPISFTMLLVAVPLALFLTRLPLSVAGIGVGEAAEVYALALFGVPPVQSLALALTARAAELLGLLPGAVLWYDLVAAPRRRARHAAGDASDRALPDASAKSGAPVVPGDGLPLQPPG
ncbi:MAG TPA: lysylphosphatidylglycerol synthase transmembrane domain-containing protein [Gemmatimonadaceae bacterium]